MRYVTRKCPRCKYVFELMNPDWVAFDDPRVKCPKCGLIVIFNNIKEWKLRSWVDKFWIILGNYTFQNAVVVAMILIPFFLISALVPALWGKTYNDIVNGWNDSLIWTVFGIIIFIPIAVIRHRAFMRDIRESNTRMKDSEYAEMMKRLIKH